MNITKIRLIGLYTVDLPIVEGSPYDRFVAKSVDGLDPTEIDVFLAPRAAGGSSYQGRRSRDRQLIFRIGLGPSYSANETHADLRKELMGLLASKNGAPSVIQLMNEETVVAVINGWASKFEAVLFTKDPEVQVTVECDEANFSAPTETSLPLVINAYNPAIPNPGTAESPFRFQVHFVSNSAYFMLFDKVYGTGETPIFQVGKDPAVATFQNGDLLIVDTTPNQKEITRVRAGVETNLLNLLTRDSIWPILQPGDNFFWVYPHFALAFDSLTFTPRYLGV